MYTVRYGSTSRPIVISLLASAEMTISIQVVDKIGNSMCNYVQFSTITNTVMFSLDLFVCLFCLSEGSLKLWIHFYEMFGRVSLEKINNLLDFKDELERLIF